MRADAQVLQQVVSMWLSGLPLHLVFLGGLLFALLQGRRYPRPSLLVAIGCGLHLVAGVVMPILYAVLPRLEGLPTAFVYPALGVLGSVLRAVSAALLLVAVYAGRKPRAAPPLPPTL
jgi:hypothetical protein